MGSAAEKALSSELLAELRHNAQTTTEFMERLGGQIVNNVLEVWSGVFPADGVLTREYNVAAGSITVNHLGNAANIVTVSSAGPGSSAPTGTGTYVLAGGTERTVPLASRQVTLYGTAADRVSFAVYTAGPRPVS